jgi:hypothetical protein
MTKEQIMREMLQVEAKINGPEGKGKLTILKSYQRKLYKEYQKAAA